MCVCLLCSIESYGRLVPIAPLCGAHCTGALSIRKPGMVQRPLLVQNSVCRMIPYTTCLCYRRQSANRWVIVHPTGQDHNIKVCIETVITVPFLIQGLFELGSNLRENNLSRIFWFLMPRISFRSTLFLADWMYLVFEISETNLSCHIWTWIFITINYTWFFNMW